jgi:hypothetical protein
VHVGGVNTTTADCSEGLRLNVTMKVADCVESTTKSSLDLPGRTGGVCGQQGRCLADKYHDVGGVYLVSE